MSDLSAVPAQWVTLRAATEDGLPVVVLVDRAVATTCPHQGWETQVAVGLPYAAADDGTPLPEEQPRLAELEQRLVDAAAPSARLVAVMTLEGVREWTFYGRDAGWVQALQDAGTSVVVTDDPSYRGLRELSGLS